MPSDGMWRRIDAESALIDVMSDHLIQISRIVQEVWGTVVTAWDG